MSPYRKYHYYDPRRYIKLAAVKLGRRGIGLCFFGILFLMQGLAVFTGQGLQFGPEWFDKVRGVIWIAAAVATFVNAPRKQGNDAWGFFAVIASGMWMVTLSLALFTIWVMDRSHPLGNPVGLAAAIGYGGLFIGWPMLLIGWRENVDPKTGRFE